MLLKPQKLIKVLKTSCFIFEFGELQEQQASYFKFARLMANKVISRLWVVELFLVNVFFDLNLSKKR